MSLDSYDNIFHQFPAVSAEEWKNKIIKDLKGEAFEKLIWHNKEGIEVLPFYTKEDNQKYQLQIPQRTTGNWQITERIIVDEVSKANKDAISALESGATAIIFDLQDASVSQAEIAILINNILLDIAPVTFENYSNTDQHLLEHFVKNSCPVVVAIPPQETITDELVYALQNGLKQESAVLRFHFFISDNYFFEIAKLRAFRWLWKNVCELDKRSYHIFIQSETGFQNRHDTDDYTNMLRNTTEAMSAVLGGCDSLIINSHDILKDNTDFGKRIARNINHILQHESYFNDPESRNFGTGADAAKGSYYIEYLTYQLCKKSWEKFIKL